MLDTFPEIAGALRGLPDAALDGELLAARGGGVAGTTLMGKSPASPNLYG
jgi:hypothetical protein